MTAPTDLKHALERFAAGEGPPLTNLLTEDLELRSEWRKPRAGDAEFDELIDMGNGHLAIGWRRSLAEISDIVRVLDARDAARAACKEIEEGKQ